MPDDLDPTTARLVSELASSILPSLTKSLSASIPTAEFVGALERTNRAGNDLRTQMERAIRSSIDDSRAARSVMMQSIGTLSDEIVNLKKAIIAMPEKLEDKLDKKIQNENNDHENVNLNLNYDEMFAGTNEKLNEITELLNELIKGMQQFSETYTSLIRERKYDSVNVNVTPNSESQDSIMNNGMLEKLINDSLPGLEGLVKAQSKAQTNELHEMSREISALNEQNNAALIQEVRSAVKEEVKKYMADDSKKGKTADTKKLLMINMCLSGACVLMSFIMFLMLMFR